MNNLGFDHISLYFFIHKFGTRGSLEQHGFARNKMWLVENNPPALPSFDSTGKAYVDLVLKSSDEDTMRIWPYR